MSSKPCQALDKRASHLIYVLCPGHRPGRTWTSEREQARSSAGEHLPDTQGVGGSIPPVPTILSRTWSSIAFRQGMGRRVANPPMPFLFPEREGQADMNINVTLPDGSEKEMAARHHPRRHRQRHRQGARQGGRCRPRRRTARGPRPCPLPPTARLPSSPRIPRKGAEILRHSTAHLMAQAVKRAFLRRQGRHRPLHGGRLLLRFRSRPPLQPRGSRARSKRRWRRS